MPPSPDGPAAEVTATVAALEPGLHLLARAEATDRIEAWCRTLRASDRADLHGIADGLDDLKRLLGAAPDNHAIGEVLARLGQQTVAASQHADGDDVGRAVERLGNLLLHAGHALRGPRPVHAD